MNTINRFRNFGLITVLIAAITITGCKKDDDAVPEKENDPEVFTDVKLIFTNKNNASDVVEARAQDPDGIGVQELVVLDEINLETSKTYTLTFEVWNNLLNPADDIGKEIAEEDNEHQFFFSFSKNAFTTPLGNGNMDNSSDPLNYNDLDDSGIPLAYPLNGQLLQLNYQEVFLWLDFNINQM